jgi:hypothetical protein
MKYLVSVQKYMYATGKVEVEADSADDAIHKVEESIAMGQLKREDVEWGHSQNEEGTFETTGDVD